MGHGIDEASLSCDPELTQTSSSPDTPDHQVIRQELTQMALALNHANYIKDSHASLGLVDPELQLPWYWQSPECLAEFRASKKAPDLSVWPELQQYTICQGSDWDDPNPGIGQKLDIGIDQLAAQSREISTDNEVSSLMPFDMDLNGLFEGMNDGFGT